MFYRSFLVAGVLAFGSAAFANDSTPADEPSIVSEAPEPVDAFLVLSADDVARYQAIFEHQEKGDWTAADKRLATVENDILLGHVRRQRYMHPTAYRSKYVELRDWMAAYADHPGASRLYRLARRRRPKNWRAPQRPTPAPAVARSEEIVHPDFVRRSGRSWRSEPYVKKLLRRSMPTKAYRYLNRADVIRDLTQAERDRMMAWVAHGYFVEGLADRAFDIAVEVAPRRGDAAPVAHQALGLSAWSLGRMEIAEQSFSDLMDAEFASEIDRAMGAFWAGRARLALGRDADVAPAFERAADGGFTYYGLLARAVLGRPTALQAQLTPADAASARRLMSEFPAAARAAALVQIGRHGDADAELRLLHRRVERQWDDDVLRFAMALELPATQYEIAETAGDGFAEALYPLPAYAPADGFAVDRALIFAVIRQESRFKANAVSRAGARGLMQLMPRTASFIAADRTLHWRSRRARLNEPSLNLSLGQRYLDHLFDDWTKGDLIRTLVSYNGGPGNMRKWDRAIGAIDDPILYVERIPNVETRGYVKAVLRNLWIYRGRLGQPAPSVETMAAGAWPTYHTLDSAKHTAQVDADRPL